MPLLKACKCGKHVEVSPCGFIYKLCYDCWWEIDPRNIISKEKQVQTLINKEINYPPICGEFHAFSCNCQEEKNEP